MIDVYTYNELKKVTNNGVIRESICIRGERIKSLEGVTVIFGDLGIACPTKAVRDKTTVFESFGDLTNVHGCLWIAAEAGNNISSLGNIESVDGDVNLGHSAITDIGRLKKVGGNFYAGNVDLQRIDGLRFVGGNMRIPSYLRGEPFNGLVVKGKTVYVHKRKYNEMYSLPELIFANGLTVRMDSSWLTSYGKEKEADIIERFWYLVDDYRSQHGEEFYQDNEGGATLYMKCRDLFRAAENDIRVRNGIKKVGEGWVSETELYNTIKRRFQDTIVVQHGKPEWLGKQHLDVWLPEFNIGIEYQGKQHYFPVAFFGGESAFNDTVKRDRRKKELCEKNGCKLIEVNEGMDFNTVVEEILCSVAATKLCG